MVELNVFMKFLPGGQIQPSLVSSILILIINRRLRYDLKYVPRAKREALQPIVKTGKCDNEIQDKIIDLF